MPAAVPSSSSDAPRQPSTRRNRRRAIVLAVALAGLVGAGTYASQLVVTPQGGFAAGSAPVAASCDTSLTVAPIVSTVPGTGGTFPMTGADVSQIDASCTSKVLYVYAQDAGGANLGSGSAVVGGSPTHVSFTTPIADANGVTRFAVLIQ